MFNGKAVLIFLCIFLAGGVAGHFTGLRVACQKDGKKPEPTAQAQNQPRRPVEEWSNRFKKDFTTRVGVTPDQQAQIDPIVAEAQAEFRVLREHFGQQAADVTDRLDAQVLKLLTEEQRPKYELMIKERQERFKKKEAERAAAAARADHPPGPGEKPAPTPTNPPATTAQPTPTPSDAAAQPPKSP